MEKNTTTSTSALIGTGFETTTTDPLNISNMNVVVEDPLMRVDEVVEAAAVAAATATPTTISPDPVHLRPPDDSSMEQQPPLKKIKVEYDDTVVVEETDKNNNYSNDNDHDQFADAVAVASGAMTEDTTSITNDVSTVNKIDTAAAATSTIVSTESDTAVLVAAEVVTQPAAVVVVVTQPVDVAPLVVLPSSGGEPIMTTETAFTISTDNLANEKNVEDDLFGGTGGDEEKEVENKVSSDVVTSSSIPGMESGGVPNIDIKTEPTSDVVPESVVPSVEDRQTVVATLQESVDAKDLVTSVVVSSPSSKTGFSIPRKSSSHTKAPPLEASRGIIFSSNSKQVYTPGTQYGLPAGVNVPVTIVQSKLLEAEMNTPGSKLMDVLKSLPVNLINDALTEYDDAVEIKGANSIRNHGAYLYGVVKRYVSVRERSLNGDTISGHNPMGDDGLTSAVQDRLDQLVTAGFCSHQEMNDKVKSKIRMLSEKDAICALDDLSSVDRTQIRNFGSYLMGILNRYMRGEPSSKKSSSSSSMNHQYGGSNNGPSNRHHQNRDNRDHNRFAQPPPSHNQSLSSSSSYPPNSRKNNNNRFDNRGDGQQQQQQRPPFRMDNNNPQSFDRHRPNQQQQQQQPGTHLIPSWQQNQQQLPPNQYMGGGQANMPNNTMVQPSMINTGAPSNNFMYPGQQQMQQFPPQQQQQQASPYIQPSTFGPPTTSYAPGNNMQHQAMPPNNTGMYQPQQNGMIMGHQQQPFMGNPSSQPNMMMNQSPASQFVPNHMSQAPQGSIDILGLADKAASAIQALGATNKLNQSLVVQQGYPPQQQMNGQPMMQQQQQQGYQPPMYNNAMGQSQQQQPNMTMQQPRSGQPLFPQNQMYMPQQQQSGPNAMNQQSPPSQQQQPGARRRTTASFSELPISVQYALQNLIATGAIDGQPDDGILGMIMDLPEQMALVGLQKFAAIDKSKMRNRFAYLAGVLRKELEGIHRR